jgi:hypothetical protein
MDLSREIFLDSEIGVARDLPKNGCALENPFVFDSIARDFERMAEKGLVEIVHVHRSARAAEPLIDNLRFRRVKRW